jgi:enoyl-CoA hydratase
MSRGGTLRKAACADEGALNSASPWYRERTTKGEAVQMTSRGDEATGDAGTIRLERAGTVATLWLDNPGKRNAFDQAMLQALTEAATSLAGDDSVTAVVLRGAGSRAFGSGADLHAFAASDAAAFAARFGEMDRLLEAAVAALLALPQPLVAAIEGACFGGAVQLAVCADIRIANESMRLAIPAGVLGIVYPLDAIERLVALAGPGMTKLILMAGLSLTGTECLRAGIVELVVADGAFDHALNDLCAHLARQSKAAVAAYKRVIDGIAAGQDRASMQALQREVNASPDTWRRIAAAMAERKVRRGS